MSVQASFVESSLAFRVVGVPVPQGSMIAMISRTTNRAMVKASNEKALRAWRKTVTASCAGLVEAPISVPVLLRLSFALPRPPSIPRSRLLPCVKPDLSKLVRAVEDSLVDGGVLVDDALVVRIETSKSYAPEGHAPGVLVEPPT